MPHIRCVAIRCCVQPEVITLFIITHNLLFRRNACATQTIINNCLSFIVILSMMAESVKWGSAWASRIWFAVWYCGFRAFVAILDCFNSSLIARFLEINSMEIRMWHRRTVPGKTRKFHKAASRTSETWQGAGGGRAKFFHLRWIFSSHRQINEIMNRWK